jgi:hypothetical protein
VIRLLGTGTRVVWAVGRGTVHVVSDISNLAKELPIYRRGQGPFDSVGKVQSKLRKTRSEGKGKQKYIWAENRVTDCERWEKFESTQDGHKTELDLIRTTNRWESDANKKSDVRS